MRTYFSKKRKYLQKRYERNFGFLWLLPSFLVQILRSPLLFLPKLASSTVTAMGAAPTRARAGVLAVAPPPAAVSDCFCGGHSSGVARKQAARRLRLRRRAPCLAPSRRAPRAARRGAARPGHGCLGENRRTEESEREEREEWERKSN